MFPGHNKFKNYTLSVDQMPAARWNRACSNNSHSAQLGVDHRRIKYWILSVCFSFEENVDMLLKYYLVNMQLIHPYSSSVLLFYLKEDEIDIDQNK